jgi:hypothetical protein
MFQQLAPIATEYAARMQWGWLNHDHADDAR